MLSIPFLHLKSKKHHRQQQYSFRTVVFYFQQNAVLNYRLLLLQKTAALKCNIHFFPDSEETNTPTRPQKFPLLTPPVTNQNKIPLLLRSRYMHFIIISSSQLSAFSLAVKLLYFKGLSHIMFLMWTFNFLIHLIIFVLSPNFDRCLTLNSRPVKNMPKKD